MRQSQNYILVLNQGSDDLRVLEQSLHHLKCPTIVARSATQAMIRASQDPPYLIILAGGQQSWSRSLVNQLRGLTKTYGVTIVALTDFHAPSWLRQEENPGLDGFLVTPLDKEVLLSLVQSAWARQACFMKG